MSRTVHTYSAERHDLIPGAYVALCETWIGDDLRRSDRLAGIHWGRASAIAKAKSFAVALSLCSGGEARCASSLARRRAHA